MAGIWDEDEFPEFLSTGQVAKKFKRSVSTIISWEARGLLIPHHRSYTGGHRRYYHKDVERLAKRIVGDKIGASNKRRARRRKK